MTDLALRFDPEALICDLALERGQLATDDGLRTAVLVSLFTDARARDDDPLPQRGEDRRGWWGDALATIDGDAIGSRLWLLDREKITGQTVIRAREYAREALAWLITDRVVASIDIEVEAIRPETLAIAVTITRPTGPDRQRFDFVWNATQ